jgi:WD40 repeat protein
VISCSSDNTIMFWRNSEQDQMKLVTTERAHLDYVKCLASPHHSSKMFASGGLDCNVHIWDMERLIATRVPHSNDEDGIVDYITVF